MRKKKIFAVAAIMAMAVFAAACGKKAEDSTKASTASESEISETDKASPSTLTEDSPEIKELESMTVPEEPKVSEMGKITLGTHGERYSGRSGQCHQSDFGRESDHR